MDIDDNTKIIIKNYLKNKEKNNNSKILKYLDNILINYNKINFDNLDDELKKYMINIKSYTTETIINIINNMLIKNNIIIKDEIFEHINQGNLNSITESENIYTYNIFNEEGQTPLHKCISMGDTNILKELLKKGERIDTVNKKGNTLLEFACLQKDPNMIVFLLDHGADMKKHLYFRSHCKLKLKINDIDTAIIIKMCLLSKENKTIDLNFLLDFINKDSYIGINDLQFKDFLPFLCGLISKLPEESQNSIIEIWKEELEYQLQNKLGCPNNYLELILTNMIPFLNYPFNVSNRNVLTNELINLVKKINENNNFLIDNKFNKDLINKIWTDYKDIIPYDYLGIILSNIFSKIKRH